MYEVRKTFRFSCIAPSQMDMCKTRVRQIFNIFTSSFVWKIMRLKIGYQ